MVVMREKPLKKRTRQRGKKQALINNISGRGSLLVAFSGGTDSALLAALARDILGQKTCCVFIDSPLIPRTAREEAERVAREIGFSLEIITAPVMKNKKFLKNPVDRCYICKTMIARILNQRAGKLGITCIADGSNISDAREYRPGLIAMTETGIVHPFIESGITKQEIRNIARQCGYGFWNKPSASCLATRIPYGEEITAEKLSMIEKAEAYLAENGIEPARVRMHANIARIEVDKKDMARVLKMQKELVNVFRQIGFLYVTLDLAGYRTGSMDEIQHRRPSHRFNNHAGSGHDSSKALSKRVK
jgi:uncharacterized protein